MSKPLTQMTQDELLAAIKDKDTPKDVFDKTKLEIQKRIDKRNREPHGTDCLCHECTGSEE